MDSMPSKELQYTRAFQKWMREFSTAAAKDNYAELLRPISTTVVFHSIPGKRTKARG
jgi:hypothetical protein